MTPVTRSIVFLLSCFVVLCVALAATAPNFSSPQNIFNILRNTSFIAIVGIGMTMVIIAAEIDLSVGAVAAFSGMLLALLAIGWGWSLAPSILVTLATGAVVGLIVGLLRTQLGIPSFITSLAFLTALRSGSFLLGGGFSISPMPPGFARLANGVVGGVPWPVIIMLVLYAVGYLVLTHTPFGRSIYAVGGNEEAARLSGIRVGVVKTAAFVCCSVLAAFVGILTAARLNSGTPTIGTGMELDVIAAVIIGGTFLFGGAGSVLGTLLGAVFMATLKSGMVLLDVSPYSQGVVSGAVILFAVTIGTIQVRARD